jgi:hypothetical protein
MMNPAEFARRVLDWFDTHGRKQLPWKENPTPYRVWVSEIMLQQTQVATVIPYYERFMARFPDIGRWPTLIWMRCCSFWAGLGYYARARHLHQAARILRDQYGGEMPLDLAIARIAGHRPFDGGGDSGVGGRPASADSGWQRQALAGAVRGGGGLAGPIARVQARCGNWRSAIPRPSGWPIIPRR